MKVTHETQRLAYRYWGAGAACLIAGAALGILAAIPHGWPGVVSLPFEKIRPLHVTLAVGWVFLASMGAIFYFLPRMCDADWWSPGLARLQFWLLGAAGAAAVAQAVAGVSTGREYLDFLPAIAAAIGVAWICFAVNFFKTLARRPRPWPAYVWMWAVGIVLFAATLAEGHLHLLPGVGGAFPRDLTVQWKSIAGLIGSMNLLVYGTALCVAEHVAGDPGLGKSRRAFAVLWLATADALLAFARHTYAVNPSPVLRVVAVALSVAEGVLLAWILWSWTKPGGAEHEVPRKFLRGAAFWMGVNLCLGALLSIPSLNAVTHGTHVTTAHAMGSMIGVHTLVLLAAGSMLLSAGRSAGFWVLSVALPAFVACLLIAGTIKGVGMTRHGWSHFTATDRARPFLRGVALAGVALGLGFMLELHSARRASGELPAPAPGRRRRRLAFAAAAVGLASIPWWWPVRETLPSTPVELGRAVYEREACWKCHGVDAPDLAREIPPRSDGWLRAKLHDPRWTAPDSKMPSFRRLTESDAAALVAYLGSLRDARPFAWKASPAVTVAPRPAAPAPHAWCVYVTRCSTCHGYDGRGDGPAARFFAGDSMPRDFTRGLYRSRSTPGLPTDEDLYRTIVRGMPGSGMPPFAELSPADCWALVDIVKSFARRGDGRNPFVAFAREAPPIPPPPAPTPELVERGRAVLAAMKCAACHGEDLRGRSRRDGAFDWTDEAGRPIWRSRDLTRGVFKNGNAPEDLYRTIIYGQGGSPMPSFGDSLPDPLDRWALIYYLRAHADLGSKPRR